MAPVQPGHRTSLPAKSILKSSSSSTPRASSASKPSSKASPSSLFPTNKSDKRRIKHSALISKITKSHTSSNKPKRRRPNKKLVTTLSSLADALPTADDPPTTGASADASTSQGNTAVGKAAAGYTPQAQVNVIRRKSVKSKPGALKRKQKMDNEERRRWGMNVAQLSGAGGGANAGVGGVDESGAVTGKGDGGDGVRGRWAALRGFIGQTLERRADVKVVGAA